MKLNALKCNLNAPKNYIYKYLITHTNGSSFVSVGTITRKIFRKRREYIKINFNSAKLISRCFGLIFYIIIRNSITNRVFILNNNIII